MTKGCSENKSAPRGRITIFVLLVVSVALLLLLALFWPDKRMISRDIGCAKVQPGRSQQICRSVSDSMEWTWMGHAIVSPGWRVTWSALRRVYCREKISAQDIAALEVLKQGFDWRLQDGADDLLRLVRNIGSEPETSIFNPKNAQYILKDGCRP